MFADKTVIRVLIIGNTDSGKTDRNEEFIDLCIAPLKNKRIVIMSKFPDKTAMHYALKNGYEVEQFTQNWIEHGSSAAKVRDEMMINLADCVIVFHNGDCADGTVAASARLGKPFWVSYTGFAN